MTARVTEHRQYRYFDRWLTDNLANRLLRVDVTTRAFTDLTPATDRLFQLSGEFTFDTQSGRPLDRAFGSTPRRLPIGTSITATSCWCRRMVPEPNAISPGTMPDPTRRRSLPRTENQSSTRAEPRRTAMVNQANSGGTTLASGRTTPVTAAINLSIDEVAFSEDDAPCG